MLTFVIEARMSRVSGYSSPQEQFRISKQNFAANNLPLIANNQISQRPPQAFIGQNSAYPKTNAITNSPTLGTISADTPAVYMPKFGLVSSDSLSQTIREGLNNPEPPLGMNSGGYVPPDQYYQKIVAPRPLFWNESVYRLFWIFFSVGLVLSVLAIFLSFMSWAQFRHIYNFPDETGIAVRSVIMPLYDNIHPIDNRMFTNSSIDEDVLYNTTQALENIKALPIRVLNFTSEWMKVTGINSPYIDALDPVAAAGTITTVLASDVESILPATSIWKSNPMPRFGVHYTEHPTLPTDFISLQMFQLQMELIAAVQELAAIVESL